LQFFERSYKMPTAQKYKFGKAKKIKINDVPHIVVKMTGKVPAKIVRQLKLDFNEAVQKTLIVQPE